MTRTEYTGETFGYAAAEPNAEDSLENTFSCVPKVQGERRISQANGRRRQLWHLCVQAVRFGIVFFVVILEKEGI